ncbi:MAG: heparan-alpha-glucosaminide N-acetyltransferase [Bacteriovoracaceae bacterium]
MKRYPFIDIIRGLAVFLMIIFHFSYDLTLFGFASFDVNKDLFWWIFPRVIVFLFMFSVGISMKHSHGETIRWNSFLKRLLKLVVLAALISLFTYIYFPQSWIYFGTLHSIALCSIIILPFLKYPKFSLFVGSCLIIASLVFKVDIPWFLLPHASMDYIAPFPWVGVCLLGIFAHSVNLHHLPISNTVFLRPLKYMGKHSLPIYMAHQPILFSIVWIFSKLAR